MNCTNLPSFFYYLPNKYTKENIADYQLQYVVRKKMANLKVYYELKFQNSFPNEICFFEINNVDDALLKLKETYKTSCGNQHDKCYAPCNDVKLEINPIPKEDWNFVNITIYRIHDIKEMKSNTILKF